MSTMFSTAWKNLPAALVGPHVGACFAQRLFNPRDVPHSEATWSPCGRQAFYTKTSQKYKHTVHKTDYHLKWCNWTLLFSKEPVITYGKWETIWLRVIILRAAASLCNKRPEKICFLSKEKQQKERRKKRNMFTQLAEWIVAAPVEKSCSVVKSPAGEQWGRRALSMWTCDHEPLWCELRPALHSNNEDTHERRHEFRSHARNVT